MSVVEVFSIIKDIALSGAACVTSYVAFIGLAKWQKERKAKVNFDVARELAKSVYSLRDQIGYCRSPFTASSEFPENYQALDGTQPKRKDKPGRMYIQKDGSL